MDDDFGAAAVSTPALPPNWRSAKAADGKEYYFNELTGETSWTFPSGNGAAAPSAPEDIKVSVPPALVSEEKGPSAAADEPPPDDFNDALERATEPQEPPSGGGRIRGMYDGLGATMGPVLGKMLAIAVASFVVMLQSSIKFDLVAAESIPAQPNLAYSVSVGTVSFAMVLIYLLLSKFATRQVASVTLPLPRGRGPVTVPQLFALFFAVWWLFGTIILTFYGPWTTTSVSYFACWIALVASAQACATSFTRVSTVFRSLSATAYDAKVMPRTRLVPPRASHLHTFTSHPNLHTSQVSYLAGVGLASFTLFLASLNYTGEGGAFEGGANYTGSALATFGVAAGVVSLVMAFALTYLVDRNKISKLGVKIAAGFLVLLWFAAVAFLTFDAPFEETGNGFFACWCGFAASSAYAYREIFGFQLEFRNGRLSSVRLQVGDSSAASRRQSSAELPPPEGA